MRRGLLLLAFFVSAVVFAQAGERPDPGEPPQLGDPLPSAPKVAPPIPSVPQPGQIDKQEPQVDPKKGTTPGDNDPKQKRIAPDSSNADVETICKTNPLTKKACDAADSYRQLSVLIAVFFLIAMLLVYGLLKRKTGYFTRGKDLWIFVPICGLLGGYVAYLAGATNIAYESLTAITFGTDVENGHLVRAKAMFVPLLFQAWFHIPPLESVFIVQGFTVAVLLVVIFVVFIFCRRYSAFLRRLTSPPPPKNIAKGTV